MIPRVIGTPRGNGKQAELLGVAERSMTGLMERIFEAEAREEANRKADEWWAKANGVRFVHRSQIPAGFRSNGSSRWIVESTTGTSRLPLELHAENRIVC